MEPIKNSRSHLNKMLKRSKFLFNRLLRSPRLRMHLLCKSRHWQPLYLIIRYKVCPFNPIHLSFQIMWTYKEADFIIQTSMSRLTRMFLNICKAMHMGATVKVSSIIYLWWKAKSTTHSSNSKISQWLCIQILLLQIWVAEVEMNNPF